MPIIGLKNREQQEKVGDRVRDTEGKCGVIRDVDKTNCPNRVMRDVDKTIWWYCSSSLTLLEDKMETYTVKGVTYKQLKDITVKALILAGARDEDVEWFSYRVTIAIPLNEALDYASSCSEKLQWLVDQGFTEKVEGDELFVCIDGSGAVELSNGKLNFNFYPSYGGCPQKNEWRLVCRGKFPCDYSCQYHDNNAMYANVKRNDVYLLIEERFMKRKEGEMDGLFEKVGEITAIHNELYGRAFEAGKIAGRKESEAENARLRGILSEVSAECGRALKLVDKL